MITFQALAFLLSAKDVSFIIEVSTNRSFCSEGIGLVTDLGGTSNNANGCGYATQVVQVKEIMMTNSGKALDKCQKLEGGGGSSDMDHAGTRKMKGRQVASRMWWRNVKLVLILDLVVCCVLFAIWLGICKGFNCVKSS